MRNEDVDWNVGMDVGTRQVSGHRAGCHVKLQTQGTCHNCTVAFIMSNSPLSVSICILLDGRFLTFTFPPVLDCYTAFNYAKAKSRQVEN